MAGCVILAADDNENDLFFLQYAFEKANLQGSLQCVNNGERAIEYLRGQGVYADRTRYPEPDLLLLDLRMPRADGFDVLKWLCDESPAKGLPVVVLSSSDLPRDVERAKALGAADYRVKPRDPDELSRVLKELCDRWIKGGGNSTPLAA